MKARIPGAGGMGNIMQQAQKMQEQMTALQADLEAREYETSAGGGVIKVKINGKKVKTASFKAKINPANKELVTIGKGWGGWWIMEGLVATTQIYDKVLSPEQVAEIAKQISKVAGKFLPSINILYLIEKEHWAFSIHLLMTFKN